MEDFSRRVLLALAVGAAGPAAALVTLWLVAPSLVAATSPETDGGIVETTGSLLVGLIIGSTIAAGIAYVAAAGVTLVALQRTGCPRARLAWVVCLVLSPLWLAALGALDLDVTGFLMMAGLLPAAVRLGFGYAPDSGSNPISRTS